MATYTTMTTAHLGDGATDDDLAEFVALCREVARRHPSWSEQAVTDAVWGDGDYIRNAAQLLA
jgi:hypothetical protein